MHRLRDRRLALLLVLTNAALYASFLPLWEGFDEPFHYAYVEALAAWREVPVLNRTPISTEIRDSLSLVPLSRLLAGATPSAVSFEDWAHLSMHEKARRRADVNSLSPALRQQKSDFLNYEAQQAPLAYGIEVPLDFVLSRSPLVTRVLFLRLFGALASAILIYTGCCKLLAIVGIQGGFQLAVLACIFCSQMLWASVAHIGNDWLAVPLTLCFVATLADVVSKPTAANSLFLAGLLAAGLLTKAYFLVFIPVFAAALLYSRARSEIGWKTVAVALVLPLAIAGPWYLRNLRLYGSLSGTQQSTAGIGFTQAAVALGHMNWFTGTADFLRWSLWTGNWSFLSFSRATLDTELLLLALSLALYASRYRQISRPELFILAAMASFVAGLFYQAGVTWVHTGGLSTHPEPWYWQGLVPCFWILGFRGLQASGTPGRICAALLCVITAWIAALTYAAKLIPFYAGGISRATLQNVVRWWASNPVSDLKPVLLAPWSLIFALLCLLMFLIISISAVNIHRLWTKSGQLLE